MPYYYWRKGVLKLNRSCTGCGATEKLEADHIKPWKLYPELRFDISNGQALCNPCHKLKTAQDKQFLKVEDKQKEPTI